MLKHVLVVDDDAGAVEVLGKVLASCNAKMTVRASVLGALVSLKQGPDVVVSEMSIRGDTCAPLWRELRLLRPQVPLLVVASATARRRDVFELQSLGATAFLEKPLDHRELTFAIQELALHRERALLRSHGPRIGGYAAEVSNRYGLTPAESEVLECVLRRMTYEEVASHRRVSRNTVKSQVRVILEKCGASSLREIARDCLDPSGVSAL